jgi:hypothetical protein
MTIVRAHVEWLVDDQYPENNIVNVPHFNVGAVIPGDDPSWGELAAEIAEESSAWQKASAVGHRVKVKVYDAEAPKPNYPHAVYENNETQRNLTNWPHELALCLSYYAVHNVQRHRGRLYLTPGLMFNSQGLDTFATGTMMQKMADYAKVLEGIGGVNVDWCVWSRVDRKAYSVTDYWVDNEWDVQRRRGLKATQRITGATNEARALREAYAQEYGAGFSPSQARRRAAAPADE